MGAQIVVVGGGLAGLAAAAGLSRSGVSVIHLAPDAPEDRRTSALMGPSVTIMQDLGLIEDPDTIGVPLTKIRIIDATKRLLRAPETLFDSAEAGLEAFGWNFANAALLKRFETVALAQDGYRRITANYLGHTRTDEGFVISVEGHEDIRSAMVVGADGKESRVRQTAGIGVRRRAFAQSALVCDLEAGAEIGGTSTEFHYENGPFTLVPAGGNRANLVWIDDHDTLATLRDGATDALASALNAKSQHLFGTLKPRSAAFVFKLSRLIADTAGRSGTALVGEAAHAFPPIGAQGLNLGLRDVEGLIAAVLAQDRTMSGWADAASDAYGRARQSDLQRTSAMVDTLFRSLLSGMLPAQALRAGGLWALKALPGLRKQAFAAGMGVR